MSQLLKLVHSGASKPQPERLCPPNGRSPRCNKDPMFHNWDSMQPNKDIKRFKQWSCIRFTSLRKKKKKKNIMKSDLGLNPVSPFSQMSTWTNYLMYLIQHDPHESLVSLFNDLSLLKTIVLFWFKLLSLISLRNFFPYSYVQMQHIFNKEIFKCKHYQYTKILSCKVQTVKWSFF